MKKMKKWIIITLMAFVFSFGINNTASADKYYKNKTYNTVLLQTKRKAKHGKAVLKASYVVKAVTKQKVRHTKHKYKKIKIRLVAHVRMTAYFTRKSKKSNVTVKKVVVSTTNKSGMPLYYAPLGIIRKSEPIAYKKLSHSMYLFYGSKVKYHATFKFKKKVKKVNSVYTALHNSLGSLAFTLPGVATVDGKGKNKAISLKGKKTKFSGVKNTTSPEREEFWISYY
ncbi:MULTISPECIES: hypothetical protein [Levilactobacillus]|uniref:hypothetical protein n=1 Tax=Levilactobacillus TaxID=2767886 RepID=UPI003756FEB9